MSKTQALGCTIVGALLTWSLYAMHAEGCGGFLLIATFVLALITGYKFDRDTKLSKLDAPPTFHQSLLPPLPPKTSPGSQKLFVTRPPTSRDA